VGFVIGDIYVRIFYRGFYAAKVHLFERAQDGSLIED